MTLDIANFEVGGDYDVLPDGVYKVQVEKSEQKQNKNKNGEYLRIQFRVIGDKYQNRVLSTFLNVKHPNTQTEKIAQKELFKIALACGFLPQTLAGKEAIEAATMLNNSICEAKVTTREFNGEKKNNIVNYIPCTPEGIKATESATKAPPTATVSDPAGYNARPNF